MASPFHDDVYQGFNRKNRYFEGWYIKSVSRDQRQTLSVIPGVSLAQSDPHAFIQLFWVDGTEAKPTLKTDYVRFPLSDFKADRERFEVSIGNNRFSSQGMTLDIPNAKLPIRGSVTFSKAVPLPKTWWSPSIMGPFAYMPAMECYHGIVSMTHAIEGSLTVLRRPLDFTGGKGYIEKDYGKSFPSSYVWVQANHFEEPDASFFFSYAKIPFLGLSFTGLICNLYVRGNHYRFATYYGNRVRREIIDGSTFEYTVRRGSMELLLRGRVQDVASLPSPRLGRMIETIKEGLSGEIEVRLMKRGKVVFSGTSKNAGIEIMKKGLKH